MMVILLMVYCWYKGLLSNNNNSSSSVSSTKSWIYSKIGFNTSGNKKENNNKYAYQRLNMRRSV